MNQRSDTQLLLTPETAASLLSFMHIAERLKNELRHSFTSSGRHESVAEHSWRVMLLALLLKPYLPGELDWERLVEMLAIHDLPEARSGDVPMFARTELNAQAERLAMVELYGFLPQAVAARIQRLWDEFESGHSLEAQIANSLDKLEAQIQHNEADLGTWVEWEKRRVLFGFSDVGRCHPSISTLAGAIIQEATAKLAKGGHPTTEE